VYLFEDKESVHILKSKESSLDFYQVTLVLGTHSTLPMIMMSRNETKL